MPVYFPLARIKSAITHLRDYKSGWVLVPLVFAVNGVNDTAPRRLVDPGTDAFLDRYFHGSLIGLPNLRLSDGANLLRPRFSEVQVVREGDFVGYQSMRPWANNYSSRGYREMKLRVLCPRVARTTPSDISFRGTSRLAVCLFRVSLCNS
jgi:hypothetical protein